LSHTSKADIVERLAIPAERVSVVPTGIDPSFTPIGPQSESAREVRRRYGLPPAFVLTVGSVEPRKNLPRLLEAIHQLRARAETADIVFVHAGPEGWLADGLYPSIRALGLSDVVRFLGYVPHQDLTALYGLARLCAYPSLSEGFGLPVAEAMACGCPVVTSNVSALPEVAGDAALLVDPGSEGPEGTLVVTDFGAPPKPIAYVLGLRHLYPWCDFPQLGAGPLTGRLGGDSLLAAAQGLLPCFYQFDRVRLEVRTALQVQIVGVR